MTRPFFVALFITLAPFVRTPAAPSKVVSVRLIDIASGRGVRNVRVWLYLGDPRPHGAPYLEERTGEYGTAVFHLNPPLPDQLLVYDEVDRIRSCSHGLLRTKLVIHNGVVADNVCDPKGKRNIRLEAKPGEIIVFVRRLRWWDLQN